MRSIIFITFLAAPAVAQQVDDMTCSGQDPDWALEIAANTATLDYVRPSDMTLQLVTTAEGKDWPQAFTFVGRGDTAIVLLENPSDDGQSAVRVLTQRGETPLLLIGSCLAN
ncbi:MAG: hypothetical protein KIH44_008230 [Octadecabacter sp.]|nr:hypothetical protein [Octadecabacter sp.]